MNYAHLSLDFVLCLTVQYTVFDNAVYQKQLLFKFYLAVKEKEKTMKAVKMSKTHIL